MEALCDPAIANIEQMWPWCLIGSGIVVIPQKRTGNSSRTLAMTDPSSGLPDVGSMCSAHPGKPNPQKSYQKGP